ncbi:helix-turn-helix domain-containing protein [Roseovarius sp. CH_XMU1461]|uniref:helix-turn-helix domain-containing protein n=1 Tax=Roseovarius sp. CH_XMU1461 TaxID=3107777 RepID=UPI00300AA175
MAVTFVKAKEKPLQAKSAYPANRKFLNIAKLARVIDESRSAEQTYSLLTKGVCDHSEWDISSIQVLDQEAGLAIPIVRHDPQTDSSSLKGSGWDARLSPVGRVLELGAPLVIRDAAEQDEFPGFREDARRRGYHTTVMIPLDVRDAQKRAMVYSVASRTVVDVSSEDLGFLQCVAELTSIAVRKIRKIEKERKQAQRLKSILENMTASLNKTLDSEATDALATGLSSLFPTGWLAVDLTSGRALFDPAAPPPFELSQTRRAPDDLVRAALDAQNYPSEAAVDLQISGDTVSAEVSALHIDGSHVGALFFFQVEQLSDHERIAAQAGRLALSSYILRSFIEFRSRRVTARRLMSRLLLGDWRDREEIFDEAHVLDFDLEVPMQLLVLRLPQAGSVDDGSHSFIQRSAQATFGTVISCFLEGDLVLLLSDERDEARQRKSDFLSRIKPVLPTKFQMVMSGRVASLEALPDARQTCLSTLDVARSMGLEGWISPMNMGEFPHLMASTDLARANGFVERMIPQALKAETRKAVIARETLAAFLRSGRRHQETADALKIHVTTLRYRLEQLSDLHGINFDDSDRCFELDLALRLLKLKNSYQS